MNRQKTFWRKKMSFVKAMIHTIRTTLRRRRRGYEIVPCGKTLGVRRLR